MVTDLQKGTEIWPKMKYTCMNHPLRIIFGGRSLRAVTKQTDVHNSTIQQYHRYTSLTCRLIFDLAFRAVSYPSHRARISNKKSKIISRKTRSLAQSMKRRGVRTLVFVSVRCSMKITLSTGDSKCQSNSQMSNHITGNLKPI